MDQEVKILADGFEFLEIDSLVEYGKNSRHHPAVQIDQLVELIKKVGFTQPLLVDKENNILAGHGRLSAARRLNMKSVPVVRLGDITPAEFKALSISDNKIAMNAGWHYEFLAEEMKELEELDFDLDLIGFSESDIETLTKELDEEIENSLIEESLGEDFIPDEFNTEDLEGKITDLGKTDPDEVPEVPPEPKTMPGDIYKLGEHRLMCGDSTNISDIEALMDGKKADMVFTDPPYGVSYQSNVRKKSARFDVLKNDDKIISDWLPLANTYSVGFCFIWTTWKVIEEWLSVTKDFAPMTNMVVWDKGGGGIGDLKKTYVTDHEIALVFNRGSELTGKRIGSVWSIGKDRGVDYIHPTQKPVELAEQAIKTTTNRGDLVLDFFGGSGSTLIACESTGRKARLMELDPKYCDVIVKRWEEFTGKTAELVEAEK